MSKEETVREKRLRLREAARKRLSDRPNYPDTPEQIAEQEENIRLFWPMQVEAMIELEEE